MNSSGTLSDIVLEDEPPRLEGAQKMTGEELPPQNRVNLNDVDGVKLLGPSFTDVARLQMRRNRYKHPLIIRTWNVRSMNLGKLEIVKNEMERININILGISELKWTGIGHFESDNLILYYTGNDNLERNGIAFIVKKNISRSILKYNAVSDRIISIHLQGRPVNMTIIQIYAPTTRAKDEEIEDFYQLLQSEIDRTCNQDASIITGNWNAKVGNKGEGSEVGKYGLGDRNNEGDRMIEFCKTNDFFITNTFFHQHKWQLYTQTSPDGTHRNQIDYICGKRRWKSSISSVRTRPGADCGTDHQLLICKFKLKLKKIRESPQESKYDLEYIPPEFRDHLKNRFDALNTSDRRPDELWNDIKDIIPEESKRSLKRQERKKRPRWMSEETLKLALERRAAKAKGRIDEVKELNRRFQRVAGEDKVKYYNDLCKELEMENQKGRTRSAFLKLKELEKKIQASSCNSEGFCGENIKRCRKRQKKMEGIHRVIIPKRISQCSTISRGGI
ncbi:craniofacial development protein 2-like [Loxodonta africana]|uniref:craniofacial development protein 2-like n=1 Tax=Loxodonta africana TaxID=9785 RepID=UPI0030D006F6